jgi:hypothetical protein
MNKINMKYFLLAALFLCLFLIGLIFLFLSISNTIIEGTIHEIEKSNELDLQTKLSTRTKEQVSENVEYCFDENAEFLEVTNALTDYCYAKQIYSKSYNKDHIWFVDYQSQANTMYVVLNEEFRDSSAKAMVDVILLDVVTAACKCEATSKNVLQEKRVIVKQSGQTYNKLESLPKIIIANNKGAELLVYDMN